MYCVIKCIVCGNQACVKNADLRHPSCTVVMYKHKSASPIHNVLIPTMVETLAPTFCKLPAFVHCLKTSETLLCITMTINVTTVLHHMCFSG